MSHCQTVSLSCIWVETSANLEELCVWFWFRSFKLCRPHTGYATGLVESWESEPLLFPLSFALPFLYFFNVFFFPFHLSFPEVRHLNGRVTVTTRVLQTDAVTLLLPALVKGCAVCEPEAQQESTGAPCTWKVPWLNLNWDSQTDFLLKGGCFFFFYNKITILSLQ